jgi:hypothetical protein
MLKTKQTPNHSLAAGNRWSRKHPLNKKTLKLKGGNTPYVRSPKPSQKLTKKIPVWRKVQGGIKKYPDCGHNLFVSEPISILKKRKESPGADESNCFSEFFYILLLARLTQETVVNMKVAKYDMVKPAIR